MLCFSCVAIYNPVQGNMEDEKDNWQVYINTVPIVIDLPWFGEYQDRLASYAYLTCKDAEKNGLLTLARGWYDYNCVDLVKTWNSENGGWNKDRVSEPNKNGSRDYGFCQLNSEYHSAFIFDYANGKRGYSNEFSNPIKQFDYCLWVWLDASKRGIMPRYGYYKRFERDKGITFGDGAGTENTKYAKLKHNKAEVANDKYVEDEFKKCEKIGYTKMDFIQIDTYSGELHDTLDIPSGEVVKIYKCTKKELQSVENAQ